MRPRCHYAGLRKDGRRVCVSRVSSTARRLFDGGLRHECSQQYGGMTLHMNRVKKDEANYERVPRGEAVRCAYDRLSSILAHTVYRAFRILRGTEWFGHD